MSAGKRVRRKKVSHDLSKVSGPPKGQPWVWRTPELLTSPAWRSQSINCRRLIEFLEVEHMHHAGLENGYLFATYDQLVEWGVTRRLVHETITQAERLGLIECHRGGRKGFTKTHLSRFRLTYLASQEVNEQGQKYYAASTDEWQRVSAEQAAKVTGREVKIQNLGSEGELSQFPKGNSNGSRRGTVGTPKTAENGQSTTVPEGEPLSISTGTAASRAKGPSPPIPKGSGPRAVLAHARGEPE